MGKPVRGIFFGLARAVVLLATLLRLLHLK